MSAKTTVHYLTPLLNNYLMSRVQRSLNIFTTITVEQTDLAVE